MVRRVFSAAAVKILAAGISMSSSPAMAVDGSFSDCVFSKMRPEVAAGRVPKFGDFDEPASLIVVRAVQRCEAEGYIAEEGTRWHRIDWYIEWISHVRQQANDYALEICGDSCPSEILERAYSNELRRLAADAATLALIETLIPSILTGVPYENGTE